MSRSQGAANGGWHGQGHPAGEPDPRTGGRPAQRPQARPNSATGSSEPGLPTAGLRRAAGAAGARLRSAGLPLSAAASVRAAAGAGPPRPVNRQGLSSLDSARNAPPTQDFDNHPRTQPPAYAQQARQAPPQQRPQPPQPPIWRRRSTIRSKPLAAIARCRRKAAPQYAPRPRSSARPTPITAPPPAMTSGQLPPRTIPTASTCRVMQRSRPTATSRTWTRCSRPTGRCRRPPTEILRSTSRAMVAAKHGYDQQHGGALEPTYNQDDAGAYEAEEPRRGSWTMRIAGAVVVAIGLGYGLGAGLQGGARRAARRRHAGRL